MTEIKTENYIIASMQDVSPQPCPCGTTRRAFVDEDNDVATFHLLQVDNDAQTHYHKTLTEIYYFLEGEGHMELDGEMIPVKPMTAIMIKPGCRHRAVGNFKILITAMPPFDPEDEWFD